MRMGWLLCSLLASGCYLTHEPAGKSGGAEGRMEGDLDSIPGAIDALPTTSDLPRHEILADCAARGRIEAGRLPLDILFVVDNSASMREEQEALVAQFPRLIEALTSGDRDGDGQADFPPVADLHLGVVNSDLGLPGISGIPGCEGLGSNGVLLDRPPDSPGAPCEGEYPAFLSYRVGESSPAALARDFACLAVAGTEGCGFEQQLEAGLKALWPSRDIRLPTGARIPSGAVEFLGDVHGFGRLGNGSDANAGFVRHEAPSLLAVVVVTDEEDCSSRNTRHFTPDVYLDPEDPLFSQDLNLRCFLNPQNLYPVERYVNGFRALRGGAEHLFTFGAIAGVPPDLVSTEARAKVDFSNPDEREAYYARILNDERMRERVDADRSPEQGGRLLHSCTSPTGSATPPRRIVELAAGLGEGALVQSICQDDFRPVIDAFIDKLGETLEIAVCLDAQR